MTHSIRFPLPFNIHVGFVVISVILLILCYSKKKHLYELLMLIGVASTMLVYVTDTKPLFYILGLEEIILFIMTIIDMHKVSKEEAMKEKAEEQAADESAEPADELVPSSEEPSESDIVTDESENATEKGENS
ncbi:MAG: hypothetical protein ACI4JJ_04190 [Huintestinicola sp.]